MYKMYTIFFLICNLKHRLRGLVKTVGQGGLMFWGQNKDTIQNCSTKVFSISTASGKSVYYMGIFFYHGIVYDRNHNQPVLESRLAVSVLGLAAPAAILTNLY